MSSAYSAFADLPDDQLLAEVTRLASRERQATADLVASLVVLDARRLYLREGYPSLFAYCTGALHLAEGAAYLRIEAARAVRRLPVLLDRLANGGITLTGVKLLAPHLTEDNHLAVLELARGKSTREIEQLVAQLRPQPDVPSVVRKLPARPVPSNAPALASLSAHTPLAPQAAAAATDASPLARPPAAVSAVLDFAPLAVASTAAPPPRAVVAPLAPERYKVQMTIGAETHERLCRARALLRDAIPDGDPAAIFDRALVLLLERLERQKWGARKGPSTTLGETPTPAVAGGEARKDRARAAKRRDASRGVRAGATERPGSGHPCGTAACPGVTGGEQPATRAAAARKLVAKRGRAADGHAARSQPHEVFSKTGDGRSGADSRLGPPACPATFGGEQPASLAAGTKEFVAKRVPAADGHAVNSQADEALSSAKTSRRPLRRIPAAVRRVVWLRANGQCTYVSPAGQRCEARSRLEFHHVVPYVDGGQATVEQITLLCRAHHLRETERWFGERPARPPGHASR